MKKKLQVFISSTYEDMKLERQKAVEAILAAGHIPAGMELFASENAEQWAVIQRWIRESDVFLILLGGRYGSIEPISQKSYTHREYEYAVEKNKPIVSVVISKTFLDKKVSDGIYTATLPLQNDDPRYIELKRAIQSKMSAEYNEISGISAAISRIFANNSEQFDKCSGWIAGREFKKAEKGILSQYEGVKKASIGLDRDREFRLIRDRAQSEIHIIGTGMSKLARLAANSLKDQLRSVSVHLYMLDPDYLESNTDYAHLLEDFFGIRDFAAYVRLSFRSLKAFCEDHNSDPNSKNRITLSTYTVLPTMSMVVIDSQSKSAEMVVEYFTYHCGEERPLFIIKKKKRQKCLIAYILMRNNYFSHLRKWSNEFDIETAGRQF
jgi:hypothetical protein